MTAISWKDLKDAILALLSIMTSVNLFARGQTRVERILSSTTKESLEISIWRTTNYVTSYIYVSLYHSKKWGWGLWAESSICAFTRSVCFLSISHWPQYGDAWCNADMAQLRVLSLRVSQRIVSSQPGSRKNVASHLRPVTDRFFVDSKKKSPCRDLINRITCQSAIPLMGRDVWNIV